MCYQNKRQQCDDKSCREEKESKISTRKGMSRFLTISQKTCSYQSNRFMFKRTEPASFGKGSHHSPKQLVRVGLHAFSLRFEVQQQSYSFHGQVVLVVQQRGECVL